MNIKPYISIFLIISLTVVSCHRVYVGGGTAYPTGNGYVSVGGEVDTDDTSAAIVAASLLGILIGSAIYNDVHSYKEKGLSAYDINIRPKDADIFLDGVYVGKADDFDGSPKFLVVKPGTHTITARKSGYKTYTVRVQIKRGEQININKHLEYVGLNNQEQQTTPLEKKSVTEKKGIFRKFKTVTVSFQVNDNSARIYFDNTFVGTIDEIKNLHKPLLIDTNVKKIIIKSRGIKVEFDLDTLVKEQGNHIVIKTKF